MHWFLKAEGLKCPKCGTVHTEEEVYFSNRVLHEGRVRGSKCANDTLQSLLRQANGFESLQEWFDYVYGHAHGSEMENHPFRMDVTKHAMRLLSAIYADSALCKEENHKLQKKLAKKAFKIGEIVKKLREKYQ
jgi:hypothetical protein